MYLWHLRSDHINEDKITRLVKDQTLNLLKKIHLPPCEFDFEGKMIKRPFNAKGTKATQLLEFVHTNVCSPVNISARAGHDYYITFIYDYSKF